jgi:hypothetical protein
MLPVFTLLNDKPINQKAMLSVRITRHPGPAHRPHRLVDVYTCKTEFDPARLTKNLT